MGEEEVERDFKRLRKAVEKLVRFSASQEVAAELLFDHGCWTSYDLGAGLRKGPELQKQQLTEGIYEFFNGLEPNKFYGEFPSPENRDEGFTKAINMIAEELWLWQPTGGIE
jgi:hypothetical protein